MPTSPLMNKDGQLTGAPFVGIRHAQSAALRLNPNVDPRPRRGSSSWASPPRGIVGVPLHAPCTPARASPPSRSCPAPQPRHRARRGPIQQTAGTHLHHGRSGSTRLATTATRSKPERAALCVGRRHGLIGAVRHTGKTGADCEAHERCCFRGWRADHASAW